MDRDGDGKVTKEELPELMRGRFEQLDSNQDGTVDEQELSQAAGKFRSSRGNLPDFPGRPTPRAPGAAERLEGENPIGLEREEVAAFLRRHDKDLDGRVSLAELPPERAPELNKFDSDGNGFLTPDELARWFAGTPGRPARRAPRESAPNGQQ